MCSESAQTDETTRHHLDHGWNTPEGYICDGCRVLGVHEHRCHEDHAGPQCVCKPCHPTEEELENFRKETGTMSDKSGRNRIVVVRTEAEGILVRFVPQEAPFPYGMPPEMARLARDAAVEMLVEKGILSRDACAILVDEMLKKVAPYFYGHA